MKKIGIIGAGNMGSGIVQKTAQEGLSVVMVDLKQTIIDRGLEKIKKSLQECVARNLFDLNDMGQILERIQSTTHLENTRDCDLIIEAVYENMDAKKGLFSELDSICHEDTIFATNTSSYSVSDLAKMTNRADRFIGLHFFYHPAKNRLLEIIPGHSTSLKTIASCKQYSRMTGKTEIIVKDSPGFAVNRFFVPWLNEATRILEEGWANIPTIDRAAMDSLGIGMGPFKLMNVTGIPVAYQTASMLGEKFGTFYEPSETLKMQYEAEDLWPLEGEVTPSKTEKVKKRLLSVIFYVSATILEEDVADMASIDIGAKVGLRWQKGPFELMNHFGLHKAYAMVQALVKPNPEIMVPNLLSFQGTKGEPWDIRYVKYDMDNEIGRITISRPETLNALNPTIVKQLDEAFLDAEKDAKTKAIILESTGKAFAAGADIDFFIRCIKENLLVDNFAFTTYGQEVFNRIDNSKKVVVAKVLGLALGGGFELALSTDVIVATPNARMGFPETGLGIYPALGGTQRTSRFIGKELAKYLIFTGRLLSAEEALSIGMIDYIFVPQEIDEKIVDLILEKDMKPKKGIRDNKLPPEWQKIKELFADKNMNAWLSGEYLQSDDSLISETAAIIARKAPIAIRLTGQIIDDGYNRPLKEGLQQELAHLNEIFSTSDALTGLMSVGKGRPKFMGR